MWQMYVDRMTKTRHAAAFLPLNLPLLLPAGFLPLLLTDPIADVRIGSLEHSRRADGGNLKGSLSEITLWLARKVTCRGRDGVRAACVRAHTHTEINFLMKKSTESARFETFFFWSLRD